MKIDISVIVPVYNVEEYLEECLNSLILQTKKEFEVIAINDGSTDNSLQILNKFNDSFENITIINQKNAGLSVSRNVGIESAKGKYILFLDSDDILAEDTLEQLFNTAELNNLDLVVYDALAFDEISGKKDYSKYSRQKNYKKTIMNREEFLYGECKKYISLSQLHFYKLSVIMNNNLRFKEGLLHEDTHFSILSYRYINRIGYVDKKLYLRRYRPNSIMTGNLYKNNKSLDSYIWIIKDFKNINTNNFVLNKLIKKHSRLLLSNLIRYENMSLKRLYILSKETGIKFNMIRVILNLIVFKIKWW